MPRQCSCEALPETARAEPDGGRRLGALFIHHALRAAEMLEQEVKIILRGLEGQLVQQLLGGRGLWGIGEDDGGGGRGGGGRRRETGGAQRFLI